jgi:hypothetical protein
MDDDRNPIMTRIKVVVTYGELLDCSMAGHLHWFLNDENDCAAQQSLCQHVLPSTWASSTGMTLTLWMPLAY